MSDLDSKRARILARVYQRVDGDPESKALFSNLDGFRSDELLRGVSALGTEVPVLVARTGSASWIILTSRRLLISQNGSVTSLQPEQVRSVSADLAEELQRGRIHKGQWKSMKVTLATGGILRFEVESQANLLGLTSAISWLLAHPYDPGR